MGNSERVKMAGQIGGHVVVSIRADNVIDTDSDARAAGCRCAEDDRATSRRKWQRAGTVVIDLAENKPLLDRPIVVEPVHPGQRSEIVDLVRGGKAAIIDARIGIDEDAVQRGQATVVLPKDG